MWKSCDRGRSSPEDQTSLERDFKQNVGVGFYLFPIILKPRMSTLKKIKVISYPMLAK